MILILYMTYKFSEFFILCTLSIFYEKATLLRKNIVVKMSG